MDIMSVHIVKTGNSLTKSSIIRGIYTNKTEAEKHKYELISKGHDTGNDFVSLRTHSPSDHYELDIDIEYRVVYIDYEVSSKKQHETVWVDSYEAVRDIQNDLNSKKSVVTSIQQKFNGTILETDDKYDVPWENSWNEVRE